MTYLFIVITIGVINALNNNEVGFSELLFANTAIVALTYFLERYWENNLLYSKTVVYENTDIIKPENHEKLIAELIDKTGLSITDCKIGRINFIENRVNVKFYYKK